MGRGRGLSIMLLAVAVTAGGLPVPGGRQVLAMAPNAWPQRLAGTTRAATAAAVAEALYPQGVPTHQALLASGASANLLDALVAGPLAAAWHVPILLTNSTTALNPSTLAGLQQLGVTQVVLVGADNSPTLAAACRQAGLTVAGALGDADPQDTAASVAQALAQATHGLASTVWVTSAAPANLVDALAGGAAAASTLSPILLVPPPDNGETALPDDEARWAQAARTAFQLGVVAPAQVQGLPPSTQVVPLAGQDRFGTAARIAAQAFPRPAGLLVADGLPHHLSDAVTAAPLAAAWGAPIVLVNSDSVPASLVQRYLGALDPSLPVTTLGGTAAIPPGNLGRIQDALGATLPQHLHIVAPQGAPTPDPRFGIANAQNGPAAAAALGAGWTRIPFFWNELEPQPGQYNGFATNWDAPESQLAQAGLHLVGVIEGAPRWAEANPQPGVETAPKGLDRPWNDPANLWGQFVYRLAKHYTGLINTWIIGNEISIPQGPYATWGGTIPQFAQMIAVAYQAIHAANPAAHVLAPATPYWYAKGQVTAQLLQALSQLPGAQENHDYLDGLDVNLYNTIEYNPTIYATYQNLLQQAGVGDLPIWLTETNVAPKTSDNPQGASPTEQASFLVEQLATSFQWVQRAEAYQLQDSGGDQYGLLAADGTPRLEATAFQVLAQALDGATWLSNQLWTWKRGYPTPSTPAIATWGAPGQLIQIVWDQGFQPTTV
ncbi:MAG: cell wall-binding repeat-containing protein, partial [Firmicutes bacterium]|nr:cell wall-binding repeat-containing protein [Bacillota bacterium]